MRISDWSSDVCSSDLPLMAYYDVDNTKVRYLGSTQWNDPELGREPALTGGWFAAPSPDTRRPFEQRYSAMFGSPPPGLASLAYDAVSLAAVMARPPGGPAYDADAPTQPRGFAGVDATGRGTGWVRVCESVSSSVVAVAFKKKKPNK